MSQVAAGSETLTLEAAGEEFVEALESQEAAPRPASPAQLIAAPDRAAAAEAVHMTVAVERAGDAEAAFANRIRKPRAKAKSRVCLDKSVAEAKVKIHVVHPEEAFDCLAVLTSVPQEAARGAIQLAAIQVEELILEVEKEESDDEAEVVAQVDSREAVVAALRASSIAETSAAIELMAERLLAAATAEIVELAYDLVQASVGEPGMAASDTDVALAGPASSEGTASTLMLSSMEAADAAFQASQALTESQTEAALEREGDGLSFDVAVALDMTEAISEDIRRLAFAKGLIDSDLVKEESREAVEGAMPESPSASVHGHISVAGTAEARLEVELVKEAESVHMDVSLGELAVLETERSIAEDSSVTLALEISVPEEEEGLEVHLQILPVEMLAATVSAVSAELAGCDLEVVQMEEEEVEGLVAVWPRERIAHFAAVGREEVALLELEMSGGGASEELEALLEELPTARCLATIFPAAVHRVEAAVDVHLSVDSETESIESSRPLSVANFLISFSTVDILTIELNLSRRRRSRTRSRPRRRFIA